MKIYSYNLKHDQDDRIIEKIESVKGKSIVWTYTYDTAGRLYEAKLDGRLICQCHYDKQGRRSQDYLPATVGKQVRNYRYTTDNRLQQAGNNGYTHNKQGFRILWNSGGRYTAYSYAPDYRLLDMKVENEDINFTFSHDHNGQRAAKFHNGEMVEAYMWLDFIRLAAFHDGEYAHIFEYNNNERTPHAMLREDGVVFYLHYDQVGSLRVVADTSGNVIKEILYDPFGGIIEDTNPALRIPIGYAGGLHDRDLGFVRFGWRDYDTFTSRWTAPDPIGDAGGDPDWYGYCLDDPVNKVDPLGLWDFSSGPNGHDFSTGKANTSPDDGHTDKGNGGWGFGGDGPGFPGGLGPSPGTPDSSGNSWLDRAKAWAYQFNFRENPEDSKKGGAPDYLDQIFDRRVEKRKAEAETKQRMANMYAQRQDEKAKTVAQHTAAWAKQEANLAEKAAKKSYSVIGASKTTSETYGYGGTKAVAEEDEGLAQPQATKARDGKTKAPQAKVGTKPTEGGPIGSALQKEMAARETDIATSLMERYSVFQDQDPTKTKEWQEAYGVPDVSNSIASKGKDEEGKPTEQESVDYEVPGFMKSVELAIKAASGVSPLGTYRHGSELGIFDASNEQIYQDKNKTYIGSVLGGLTPDQGILGAVGTGQAYENSTAIQVYGDKDMTPTSWGGYKWGKIGTHPHSGMDQYGWKTITEKEAMRLPAYDKAIKKLTNGTIK